MTYSVEIDPSVPGSIKGALSALSDAYDVLAQISEGGNGYVFESVNRVLLTRTIIKFYGWEGDARYHLEPQALTAFNSPNVLKVLDARIVDQSWAYFITPFCSEGSLHSLLNTGNLGGVLQTFEICIGILTGLTYLHGRRFVHRDLKPGNIYLHLGRPVIGDFGSLVTLPDGETVVPASRHSVLYRPPESIANDHYGMSGDIYQVGVMPYQLLGGYLSYDETGWLNKRQLAEYETKPYPDNTIFADDCLKERIRRGRLLDYATLNAWTPDSLRKLVKKACNLDPGRRFGSACDFLAALAETRASLPDWATVDGVLTLRAEPTSYRILTRVPPFRVQKRRDGALWRNDSTCSATADLQSLIRQIESRC